jgi:tRNA(Arg) A34 adenosine deaminase TadA
MADYGDFRGFATPAAAILTGDAARVRFGRMNGNDHMAAALAEAEAAAARGEVPVGAVLVDGATGAVLAQSGNRIEELRDPTAHAEILAIRAAASAAGAPRLPAADLYVTLEPCAMCAAAISFARVRRLYFGAYDPKGGAVEHGPRFFQQATCHHAPEVIGGLDESRAAAFLRRFFASKR